MSTSLVGTPCLWKEPVLSRILTHGLYYSIHQLTKYTLPFWASCVTRNTQVLISMDELVWEVWLQVVTNYEKFILCWFSDSIFWGDRGCRSGWYRKPLCWWAKLQNKFLSGLLFWHLLWSRNRVSEWEVQVDRYYSNVLTGWIGASGFLAAFLCGAVFSLFLHFSWWFLESKSSTSFFSAPQPCSPWLKQ